MNCKNTKTLQQKYQTNYKITSLIIIALAQ